MAHALASCLGRCMHARAHGHMGARMHGCMKAWAHESTGARNTWAQQLHGARRWHKQPAAPHHHTCVCMCMALQPASPQLRSQTCPNADQHADPISLIMHICAPGTCCRSGEGGGIAPTKSCACTSARLWSGPHALLCACTQGHTHCSVHAHRATRTARCMHAGPHAQLCAFTQGHGHPATHGYRAATHRAVQGRRRPRLRHVYPELPRLLRLLLLRGLLSDERTQTRPASGGILHARSVGAVHG